MKKLVVMAVLLAAIGVQAQPPQPRQQRGMLVEYNANTFLTSVWQHTYTTADSVAEAAFRDTVYSPWLEVPYGSKFFFTVYVDGKHARQYNGYKDTAFNADSMNINYQYAADDAQSENVVTANLGVLIPGSTDLDTVIRYAATVARDTSLMRSRYVRSMVVVKDSSTAARNIVGNTYSRNITLYLMARP